MKFICAQGTYLVEIQEAPKTLVKTSNAISATRVLNGIVKEVGTELITDYGIKIGCHVSPGDHVYFLSYEGAYDNFTYEGKTYYTVQFKDHRGVMK